MPKIKWQVVAIVVLVLAVGGWALYRGPSADTGLPQAPAKQNTNSNQSAAAQPAGGTNNTAPAVCEGRFFFPAGGESMTIGTPQNPSPKSIVWKMPGSGNNYSVALELLNASNVKLGNISDLSFVANSASGIQWDSKTIYTPDLYGTLKPSTVGIQPGNYKLRLTYRYVSGNSGGCAESGSFVSGTFTFTKN